MSLSQKALNDVMEEYEWASWEAYDLNAYWYEYLSDEKKREYQSYMRRVEPMTNMEENMQPHSMARPYMA